MRLAKSGIARLFVNDEGFARPRISTLSLSAKLTAASAPLPSGELPDSDGEPTSRLCLVLATFALPLEIEVPVRLLLLPRPLSEEADCCEVSVPTLATPGGCIVPAGALPLALIAGTLATGASAGGSRDRRRAIDGAAPGIVCPVTSSSIRASSWTLPNSAAFCASQAFRCSAASSSILVSSSTIWFRISTCLSSSSCTL
mmetsp:Transcript_52956/g.154130  ORF Transcript_52956/g.154130 Transcript_52956/m.154130 type:complete len:200 (+) Transcript_52956:420-1019(+)